MFTESSTLSAPAQVAAARAVDIRVLFKEQELSNIIWALGKLQHTDLEIYTLLLQEATDKLQFFLPQVRGAAASNARLPPVAIQRAADGWPAQAGQRKF